MTALRRCCLLLIATVLLAPEDANATRIKIYDCHSPDGDENGCWSNLDPTDANYPTQYSPYIFGRDSGTAYGNYGQDPRGPSPVPGSFFGSTDVDTAYELVSQLHQYYFDKFGRNGANGQGGLGSGGGGIPLDEVRVLVNSSDVAGLGGYWQDDRSRVFLEHGNVTPDTVGHEFNHALWFSEGVGLHINTHESGALNEAFADIFGEEFERDLTGNSDWLNADRDMSNPSSAYWSISYRFPDRYLSSDFWTGAYDNNGVHINSTIVSHGIYLAVEGGSFNGFSITGIGMDKVEQILYRAQTEYFTSSESFNNAYTHILKAANDLYGPDDVWELTKALRAVELNMSRSFTGDFDNDGDIDGRDFLTWQRGLGSLYSQATLGIWQSNYLGNPLTAQVSVPEPSAALLLSMGLLGMLTRRCRSS